MKSKPETQIKLQEKLDIIKKLRLIDDIFFNKCFDEYAEGMQLVLRVILDRPTLTVTDVCTQRTYSNLFGKETRFDAIVHDDEHGIYDVDVQLIQKPSLPKRARYYSLLDSHEVDKGTDYLDLPDTYVIFITKDDIYRHGQPIYAVTHQIDGLSIPYHNGQHTLFVNGHYRSDSALGRLMQDFFCANPSQMHFRELADRVRKFKESPKEVRHMCETLETYFEKYKNDIAQEARQQAREEGFKEGREEGREEGRKLGSKEMALLCVKNLMQSNHYSLEKAMEALNLPEEWRQEIRFMLRK